MAVTTISSREFNHDVGAAKRAAQKGPVVVTDRGQPAYVLMTHAEFRRLAQQKGRSVVDMLRQPGDVDFDFEPPRLGDPLFKPADLT